MFRPPGLALSIACRIADVVKVTEA